MQAAKYVEGRDRVGFPNRDEESQTYRVEEALEPVRESKRAKTRSSKARVDKR